MTDLDSWVEALEAELGLPPGTIDVPEVLDLARDAAHALARFLREGRGYRGGRGSGA